MANEQLKMESHVSCRKVLHLQSCQFVLIQGLRRSHDHCKFKNSLIYGKKVIYKPKGVLKSSSFVNYLYTIWDGGGENIPPTTIFLIIFEPLQLWQPNFVSFIKI